MVLGGGRSLRGLCAAPLLALTWASTALGAPSCEDLNETDFINLVQSGQTAVDTGNPQTHQAIVEELRRRVPCLTFAPRPRVLADYVVLDALLVFSEGGEWRRTLDMALRIYPRVDRNVGSKHPIARHEVGQTGESVNVTLPDDVSLFVDGAPSESLPHATELHLVQVTKNDLWRSRLVHDELVTDEWLSGPFRAPMKVRFWGHASLVVGAGGVVQTRGPGWPDDQGGEPFFPDESRVAFWPGVVARGGLQVGRLGFVAEVDVGLVNFTRPTASHGQLGLVVEIGWLKLGGGGGLGGSTYLEGDDDGPIGDEPTYLVRTKGLPYAMALAIGRGSRADGGLSFGYGPAVMRATGYFGWTLKRRSAGAALRLGVSFVGQRGTFHLSTSDLLEVSSITWRGGVELGTGR